MTKYVIPTHHIDLLPKELIAKVQQRAELLTKTHELGIAVQAAEQAIPAAVKQDAETRAKAILGDKKAGEPNAEAAARENLAALQREHAAYSVALATVTTECREVTLPNRAAILTAITEAEAATHARAVAAVDTLDAALTELSELARMSEWVASDFSHIGGAGRHRLITEAFKNIRILLAPPAPAPADEEPELAEVDA